MGIEKSNRVRTSIKIPILYTAAGFAVGGAGLPFGGVPFGFALLCSGGVRCLFAYVGLCLSLLFAENSLMLFVAYTLCFGVRAVISLACGGGEKSVSVTVLGKKIFNEVPSMRAIGAAVGAFSFGLFRLVRGGFLYYDLFGALITIGVSVAAGMLWYFTNSKKHAFLSALALSSLSGACVWGLRGFSLYGVSLSVFACMLISLVLIRYRGMRVGVLAALVCGLCVSFDLAPLFVFGAVCYSVLGAVSPMLGCVSCIAVGLAWGVYMDGIGALAALLPALVAASVLFFAVTRIYAHEGQEENRVHSCSAGDGELLARIELAELKQRGEVLGKALNELCAVISKADGITVTPESISDIQKKVMYSKSGLTAEVGEMGDVPHGQARTMSANTSDCLLAVSEYLSAILVSRQNEYTLDEALTKRLCELLAEKNIKNVECAVLGGTEKRAVFFCDDKNVLLRYTKKLCEATRDICGYTPHASNVQSVGERWYISICRGQLLRASIAGKKRNAESETEFCGDSLGMLTSADSAHAAAFICDGMGSGREAAEVSGICALFLQKLLALGTDVNGVHAAIDMTSAFLRRRNHALCSECSSTVDICTLDLRDSRASFYKCGAAQTYIFRDGSPSRLRSCTLPIGIMDKADIGYIDMELLAGDTIVMVSDGVGEANAQFFDFVREKLTLFSAKQLAKAIIEYAAALGCEDDASVVVIKIEDRGIGEL